MKRSHPALPVIALVFGLFAVIVWPIVGFVFYNQTEAQQAKLRADIAQQKVAVLQQQVTDLVTPPYQAIEFDGVRRISPPPPVTLDPFHTIFAHPCDVLALSNVITVSRPVSVTISRAFDGAQYLPIPSVQESLRAGVNKLDTLVRIPSNLQRYTWETYESVMSEAKRSYAPPGLRGFRVFVIDAGYPLPGPLIPGEPFLIPAAPSNPPAQPSCPVPVAAPPLPSP